MSSDEDKPYDEIDYRDKVNSMADAAMDSIQAIFEGHEEYDIDDAINEVIPELVTHSIGLDEVSMVLEHTENPDAMLDGIFEGSIFEGPSNVEKVRRAAERFFRRDVHDRVKTKLQDELNDEPQQKQGTPSP